MEKTEITVTIETEKMEAVTFYLQKDGASTFQKELGKAAERLYEETVPQDVREFIEGKLKKAAPKPRPKPAPKQGKESPAKE